MKYLICCLLFLHGLALGQEQTVPPSRVAGFELPDQHDKLRRVQFPRDKMTMLIVSDQKGSEQIERWVRPVRQRYETRIEIDGIADMSPVPKRLRGVVRRAFKDELDYSVMLDWEGKVAITFRYIKQKANVFIVDHDGKILLHLAGPSSREDLQRIYKIFDTKTKPAR